jgi:signal transduction histidine kinase
MRRATIRVRLTVLYGGLFFLAGAVLLTVMYLVVKQNLDAHLGPPAGGVAVSFPTEGPTTNTDQQLIQINGQTVSPGDLAKQITQQQAKIRDEALNTLLAEGGVALLVVGVVASGFGWLMAERALRPVHGITATARRVAAAASAQRGLHERIALAGPRDEIKELADTFDDMLERLDRSFDGQRRFVANASHELRTPLAINRALVEVSITRPGASQDAQRLGESLLTVNARHERLIDGLLTLAESEQAVAERSTVDLADMAGHVLDQTAAGGLTVRRQLGPVSTVGDPILLERLTQNLVENAVRHNEPGGWLSVHTGLIDRQASLTVTNTGPAVAEYELETIFEPFRRLGADRTRNAGAERGFGLGLSIVRAVARAHGGEVNARPRPGGGLVVTVRLPAEAAAAGPAGGAGRPGRDDRRAAPAGVGLGRRPGGVATRSAGR